MSLLQVIIIYNKNTTDKVTFFLTYDSQNTTLDAWHSVVGQRRPDGPGIWATGFL